MSYYIGIMSGTSLDGLDLVLVDIDDNQRHRLSAAKTEIFPENLRTQLLEIVDEPLCSLKTFGQLDIALGRFIAQQIKQFLSEQALSAQDISAIGCHGHTLFHSPESDMPFSLQIGDGNTIAEVTGITTVTDFRGRDIAAGGQGAPLVPAFHAHVFSDASQSRVIVNIGGIANISYLPCSVEQQLVGFDTGPGNALLDAWINRHKQLSYDKDGQWAAAGHSNADLLNQLLNDDYFKQAVPKSTGREYFNLTWLDDYLSNSHHSIHAQDVQATLLDLTAHSIVNAIRQYCQDAKVVYLCGGGAHNTAMRNKIAALLDNQMLASTEEIGIAPDWVEATAFAWLAYRTLNRLSGNLPSVTGATHPVILGAIYPSNDAS